MRESAKEKEILKKNPRSYENQGLLVTIANLHSK
jgi:hypothetical protein